MFFKGNPFNSGSSSPSHQSSPTDFLTGQANESAPKSVLRSLIEQILKTGVMTLENQLKIHKICDSGATLCLEDYMALELLRKSLSAGKIQPPKQKHIHNVMEQLVMDEIMAQLGTISIEERSLPDLGDIQAYVLNRLPSLYATSEEGLHYQRQQALDHLNEVIKQQVSMAINTIAQQQEPFTERTPLSERVCKLYEHLPTSPFKQNSFDVSDDR